MHLIANKLSGLSARRFALFFVSPRTFKSDCFWHLHLPPKGNDAVGKNVDVSVHRKKEKAQRLPAGLLVQRPRLCESRLQFCSVDLVPGSRGLQSVIDVLDVLYAFGLHPFHECLLPLLCKYRNAGRPSCASAKHSVEFHARLSSQLQRLGEFFVAYPGG